MKPFRYGRDRLCLLAIALYALNRWGLEHWLDLRFLHEHFNDLLLIPAALPLVLWIHRLLGLRKNDLPPSFLEILGHLAVWSILCEGIAPHLIARSSGDIIDVVCYTIGALIAGYWWNRKSSGFDFLAPNYDWMETLFAGKKLDRCRNSLWAHVPSIKHALLVGEGHGRFLAALLCRHPDAEITYVDGSAAMIHVARNRLEKEHLPARNIRFIHADAVSWNPPQQKFDFVGTHFFLDCFSPAQLTRVISTLASAAKPGAVWWISDFQIPGSGPSRWRATAIHWLMYRFFASPPAFLPDH